MAQFNSSKKYRGVQYYIKKNGKKVYYIRYRDENNKLKRVKVGSEEEGVTEKYANAKRVEIINAVNKGEQPPKIAKSRRHDVFTVDHVAKLYFESKQDTKSTRERISKYQKHIAPAFGTKVITTVTRQDLNRFMKELQEKGLSNATVNNIIELFGTIFNYGFKEEFYEAINPVTKVERLKVDNERKRFLNKDEIEMLLELVTAYDKKKNTGRALELFCKLAFTTGARLDAVLTIRKKDINLDNGTIELIDFKDDKKTYTGYIAPLVRDILEDTLPRLKADDFVVSLNYSGKKMTVRQIQGRLKRIINRLFNQDIPKDDRKNRAVIHTLRHSFGSNLALSNYSLSYIQELMHHSDIRQTQRYIKLNDTAKKNAVQKVFTLDEAKECEDNIQ